MAEDTHAVKSKRIIDRVAELKVAPARLTRLGLADGGTSLAGHSRADIEALERALGGRVT